MLCCSSSTSSCDHNHPGSRSRSHVHVHRHLIMVSIIFVCNTVYANTFAETTTETDSNATLLHHLQPKTNLSFLTTKLHVKKSCQQDYSSGCLKLDLIKLMDRLESSGPLQLLPGVTLVQAQGPSEGRSPPLPSTLPLQDSPRLDNHLYKRVNSYLKSLSLNVQILDSNILNNLKKFGEGAADLFSSENSVTARKRNKNYQAFWLAGLLSAGTMLAMGMSTLSAMAGKALMTSLLALMLAAFAALKGHNDDKKTTTYEIITRPIYTHSSHSHKHAADAVADAQMMTPTHGHSHSHVGAGLGVGPSYTYRRSIDLGRPTDFQDDRPYTFATDYSLVENRS